MKKSFSLLFDFLAVALFVVVYLWVESVQQKAPHHVQSYVMGNRLVADFWTTNPAFCEWVDGPAPGSPFGTAHLVTNYYWSVWSMFK